MTARRIAVLGAGMLGACTALELVRHGHRVTLVDSADDVMQRASRWNEGKIHLGFLYPADPSLNTAARLIPGALAFRTLVERLTGRRLDALMSGDDVYLVHRNSVVDARGFAVYANAVAAMVRDAVYADNDARYLSDVRSACVERLSASDLGDMTSSEEIVAGFRVPERSVSTVPVADAIASAVHAEKAIDVRANTVVSAVRRRDDARLDVLADGAADEFDRFDVVVNAMWEGRPAIDASLGVSPPGPWSHRLRAAIYAKASGSILRNATVCTGPFGDVKQYADGRLYLSWYEAGLLAQGNELAPPPTNGQADAQRLDRVRRETLSALAQFFPEVARLDQASDALEVHAGWVYAVGAGSLADRESTLHRRDQFAVTADRGYISADTGKYSVAPWLARQIASMIAG